MLLSSAEQRLFERKKYLDATTIQRVARGRQGRRRVGCIRRRRAWAAMRRQRTRYEAAWLRFVSCSRRRTVQRSRRELVADVNMALHQLQLEPHSTKAEIVEGWREVRLRSRAAKQVMMTIHKHTPRDMLLFS